MIDIPQQIQEQSKYKKLASQYQQIENANQSMSRVITFLLEEQANIQMALLTLVTQQAELRDQLEAKGIL